MGLTRKSVGMDANNTIPENLKTSTNQKVIALAGNPNVGKSTIFNNLTGLHQHTGNWTGKTVKSAVGYCEYNDIEYVLVDLPGCYSLNSHSPEEEVARDFLCSGKADVVVVVCDALALERNLNLFIQIKEITDKVVLCVNLMDEAEKNGVQIDLSLLSNITESTVVGTTGRNKKSSYSVLDAIENEYIKQMRDDFKPIVTYPNYIEKIIYAISSVYDGTPIYNRLMALNGIESSVSSVDNNLREQISDDIVRTISNKSKEITLKVSQRNNSNTNNKSVKIDKILTGKITGFITMLALLLMIFWITIVGANYPSEILSNIFTSLEAPIYNLMLSIHIPAVVADMLVYGVYHILTWIISVMLPPMAIFFPLFTFLEDIGYLPRIAFNLDKAYKKCSACGKQALTMCMGFGCNAAGVVGCRIIDSPRERLIAIITNSFVPCNGRFPAIISVITMFFIANEGGLFESVLSSFILALFIIVGILSTLIISKLLSKTFLKGVPSSFTLELPPYRKPQMWKIIVRSVFDRTLFVLSRAICIAAPAGLIIWIFANININDISILNHISNSLDPLGKLMGLDGVILTAFVFGFPANEIVVPLIIMMYTSEGVLSDTYTVNTIRDIFIQNGWTYVTALNTILFMLMHWPCSTTCMTIKAETKSLKWTVVSIIIPTLCGMLLCMAVNLIL